MADADLERLEKEVAELKRSGRRQSALDNTVRVLAALGAVVAFGVGIYQYVATNQNEFRKAFWTEQYALYQPACDNAAAIAMAERIDEVKKERGEFWKLYWGKMSMLEHQEVKLAMINYGRQLSLVEKGTAKPASLRLLSYELARACRESLRRTWNPADLGDLVGE